MGCGEDFLISIVDGERMERLNQDLMGPDWGY